VATYHPHRVAAIVTVVAMVGVANSFDGSLSADSGETEDALIRSVVAQTTRTGISARAMRELRAGTTSGKHQGWMDVETLVNPSTGLTWRILEEGGSERTRKKVLREVLQGEAATWRTGGDAAALTLENYSFEPMADQGSGQLRLRLKPRRVDDKLIDGVLIVSADGYPIRLEGKLAKSPSFWVRSVTVVKHYGRFAGVALPVSLESMADVRMVGQSSFSMRYTYREVNGKIIPQSVASAPSFGLSDILTLHASRN
jgi:hypothetical protein